MSIAPRCDVAILQEATLPGQLESSEEYRDVLAMTQRLFPGPVEVRRERDPEFPEEYVVFDVQVHGDLKSLMALESQWHRECGNLAPVAWYLYRLDFVIHDERD